MIALKNKGKFKDSQFDKRELAIGIKTEMEHTDDPKVAKQIAEDHLKENRHYYTKILLPAEKKADVGKSMEGIMDKLLSKSAKVLGAAPEGKPGSSTAVPNKAPRKKRGKEHKVSGRIHSKIHDPAPDGNADVAPTKGGCGYKANMGLKSLMPITANVLMKARR